MRKWLHINPYVSLIHIHTYINSIKIGYKIKNKDWMFTEFDTNKKKV